MFVGFAFPVSDACYKDREANRHVDKGQHRPGPVHACSGVHPGTGHAWHRVVMGDHAVVHQWLRTFCEIGVAGAGGAVGVELDVVVEAFSSPQHFREQQGHGAPEAVAADQ
ncbi:hypothetical protein D3C76_1534890 [compost metagenome]